MRGAHPNPEGHDRLPRIIFFCVWGGLGLLGIAALLAHLLLEMDATVYELPIYLTAVALVLSFREVRRTLAATGWVRCSVLALFAAGLVFVQLSEENRAYYPLTSWSMYSVAPPTALDYRELVVVSASGEAKRVGLYEIVPFRSRSAFYRRLLMIEGDRQLLETTLRALMEGYPGLHESDHIEWRRWMIDTTQRPLNPVLSREESHVILLAP